MTSFSRLVFPHFSFRSVLVNLDPFAGDQAAAARCKDLLRTNFREAVVFEPMTPSFGGAVRRLWLHSQSDIVLHLEDDWLAVQRIERQAVENLLVDRVKSVSLMCREKKWDGSSLLQKTTRKWRLFGKTVFRVEHNQFSTSPSFIDGAFARSCARLMNPALDPEKQFSNGSNPALQRFAERYQNRFLIGNDGPDIVVDIGRDWREQRKIVKRLVAGTSVWSSDNG